MAGVFLLAAVAGNILSNVMFKAAMAAFPEELNLQSALAFAFNPHLWLGLVASVFMLACYLLAIREIGLSITYAVVTSLSLIGITVAAAFAFREAISVQSVAGLAMVIGGILLISSAGSTEARHATESRASDLPRS